MFRMPALCLVLIALSSSLSIGAPILLLSEVLADVVGTDNGRTFVEIYGDPFASLDGVSIVARNGSGGSITHSVDLTGFTIPADGFFVVADSKSGVTSVANADLLVASLDFQNGPDSIQLLRGGVVIDALGYGLFGPSDVFFGEGGAAPRPQAGWSLARRFANVDTDDNGVDFIEQEVATPGRGALFVASSVPEPGSALLLSIGLVSALIGGTRRRVPPVRRR